VKQISKTPEITARLKAAVGDDVNLDDLVIYEATALNTMPLRKRHPLFMKATAGVDVLQAMAAQVNQESLPLHVMHYSDTLPAGRVFSGDVFTKNGVSELRVLFFLPKSATDEIELIDSGTVDQVSVSILSEKLLCSDCGWDFFGGESTFDNIYSGTCANEHQLGVGNTHGVMVGLDRWTELSLVNTGGAQKARIHSKSTSVFDNNHRLAASGIDPCSVILRLSNKEMNVMADTIELGDLIVQFTDTKVSLKLAENEMATLKAQVTELQAALDAAQAEVEALKGAKDPAVDELKAQLNEATGFIKGQAQVFAPLSGVAFVNEASLADHIKVVLDSQAALKSIIPLGGKAVAAADLKSTMTSTTASAYRSKKG
jgi:hypothetical protein